MRRFQAVILVTVLAALVLQSDAVPVGVLAKESNGGCQGMDAIEATERFTRLDGSPSDLSEWTPTETSLIHRGPRVKGKMPYGFMAYGNFAKRDRHYVLAGTQLRGKRFETTCTPDIGASYVRIIPTTCPKNLEIANRRYGGKWIEGPVPPFSGIRNILGFSKNSPRWALGSFTVPHQAIVTVMEHEGQFDTYFPGDIVPPSYRLQLTCYI